MEGQLPRAVALLLFLAALRVGPRQVIGAVRDIGQSFIVVFILQLMCPLLFALILVASGWQSPVALAVALMLTASPISGSPSLTLLLGRDGAPALRVLIAGTALLPFTSIPTFWLLPDLVSGSGVFMASLRLLALIVLATGAAFAIRAFVLKNPRSDSLKAMDGMSALTMSIMVVGLMAEIRPAMSGNPYGLLFNLAIAFIANFGLQMVTYLIVGRTRFRADAVAISISAGNRNIALFLAALPAGVMDPLLLFIGCYQVPMYLTPILLRRFYKN